MILTPLKIQTAIIKAYYNLALKTIKYYGGLAIGINNECLLKQARLLRKYVEILKNFDIVGSTITCSCCVEGEYTVLLNDLSELTEAKIQFNCDDTGGMYFNSINYPFTYYYDSNNKKIVIKFSTLIDPSTTLPYVLTLDDVNFTSDCSFTPGTISPIEEALVEEVTGIPVTIDNFYGTWDGNITVYTPPPASTMLHTLTIPVAIIDDPEAIVNHWNTNGPTDWILFYDGTQFTMITPFDGTNYSGYVVEFNQYEGGVDSTINTTFIPQNFVPTGTRASVDVDIANTFIGGKQAQALITSGPPQPFITSNTPAHVDILIPSNSFSTNHVKASMTIEVEDEAMFGTLNPSNKSFWYSCLNCVPVNAVTMFTHVGPYANPAALVTDFNNNNGNGFVMTYVGPSTNVGYSLFEIESPLNTQDYNGNHITIIYTGATPPYINEVGIFSGGVLPKPVDVTVTDTTNGVIYNITSPPFNSVQDFVTDFNNTNAFGYSASIILAPITNTLIRIEAPSTTGSAFNGTTLTYSTTGPTYSTSDTYSGGIDDTTCFYTLFITDNVNPPLSITNGVYTNYSSFADIAADINSNPINVNPPFGFNVSVSNNQMLIVYPSPFTLPESLVCSTYNNYTFQLYIGYQSNDYSDWFSPSAVMTGGIDANSKQFEISDSAVGTIFLKPLDSYNYPNGSEIQNGLVPDFNANNPFNYTAQYIGPGAIIPPQPSISSNNFITELTTATISNGEEIRAYIDNTYIGKYQAPASGVLPSYNQMILNLKNDIASLNPLGLSSISSSPTINPTTITLVSPTGQEVAYNNKLFKIQKHTYVSATNILTFGNVATFTHFQLSISGLGTIADVQINSAITPSILATIVALNINNSGTGLTATKVGSVVTVTAPPFTGGSFNGVPIRITTINTPPYNAGSVVINSTTYLTTANWADSPITGAIFAGGQSFPPTLIKQIPFTGGVNQITTSKVRFRSPLQPTTSPQYGTGNWAYNSQFLSYNYNFGDYVFNGVYSGGIDPTVGKLKVEVLTSGLNPLPPPLISNLYTDSTPQNYLSRQLLVNIFNNTNSFPNNFQINLLNPSSSVCTIQSPPTSFDYFNTHVFRYSYEYVSSQSIGGQYADYVDVTTTFSGGVDPVLTPYEGEFQSGDIGTFVTDNPCEPVVVEQECLSNNDIISIIKHIDKIVR
jgi:hypothetical protein